MYVKSRIVFYNFNGNGKAIERNAHMWTVRHMNKCSTNGDASSEIDPSRPSCESDYKIDHDKKTLTV